MHVLKQQHLRTPQRNIMQRPIQYWLYNIIHNILAPWASVHNHTWAIGLWKRCGCFSPAHCPLVETYFACKTPLWASCHVCYPELWAYSDDIIIIIVFSWWWRCLLFSTWYVRYWECLLIELHDCVVTNALSVATSEIEAEVYYYTPCFQSVQCGLRVSLLCLCDCTCLINERILSLSFLQRWIMTFSAIQCKVYIYKRQTLYYCNTLDCTFTFTSSLLHFHSAFTCTVYWCIHWI